MRQNGVRSNVRFPTGAPGMKKGGKLGQRARLAMTFKKMKKK